MSTAYDGPVPSPWPEDAPTESRRNIRLRAAYTFAVRPVHWLWDGRIALGTFALMAGREGIGKTTCNYTLVADLTQGTLPGRYYGTPKSVIIAATEDSWEHTIVPRLMAAGADLQRVFCVDVVTTEGEEADLSLPRDLAGLEEAITSHDVALVVLDPLMSRLASGLDTHKDAEVRQALEPLVRIADRSGAAVLGLIHVNKSASTDPLNTIMASRAFTAVARSVLFVMTDPDDETVRLLGTPKNNLGSTAIPTKAFTIEGVKVAETDEGDVWSSRVQWLEDRADSIREVLEQSTQDPEARTAVGEAAEWLSDYLASVGGEDESQSVKDAGKKVGHGIPALQRARVKLRLQSRSEGFPRRTIWALPVQSSPVDSPPRGVRTTATTETTATTGHHSAPSTPAVVSVVPVVSVVQTPQSSETTGEDWGLDQQVEPPEDEDLWRYTA